MVKRLLACCVFVCCLLLMFVPAMAQQPKKPTTSQPVAKFKPPVVKSMLGRFSGTSATCTAAEGVQLAALPIKVVDDKNKSYQVHSYQFAYKRIGVTEDEATGKTSPQADMVSKQFFETPLPAIWKSNIAEQLHSGEQLYFFDIIVRDGQGRLFFAPELKVTIE